MESIGAGRSSGQSVRSLGSLLYPQHPLRMKGPRPVVVVISPPIHHYCNSTHPGLSDTPLPTTIQTIATSRDRRSGLFFFFQNAFVAHPIPSHPIPFNPKRSGGFSPDGFTVSTLRASHGRGRGRAPVPAQFQLPPVCAHRLSDGRTDGREVRSRNQNDIYIHSQLTPPPADRCGGEGRGEEAAPPPPLLTGLPLQLMPRGRHNTDT